MVPTFLERVDKASRCSMDRVPSPYSGGDCKQGCAHFVSTQSPRKGFQGTPGEESSEQAGGVKGRSWGSSTTCSWPWSTSPEWEGDILFTAELCCNVCNLNSSCCKLSPFSTLVSLEKQPQCSALGETTHWLEDQHLLNPGLFLLCI